MFSIHDLTAAWFVCETKCKERDFFFSYVCFQFLLTKRESVLGPGCACWLLSDVTDLDLFANWACT